MASTVTTAVAATQNENECDKKLDMHTPTLQRYTLLYMCKRIYVHVCFASAVHF